MMKRLLTALSMAIIAASFASTASADTWSPNSPVLPTAVILISDGNFQVSKGITFNCLLDGTATISPLGIIAEINSLDLRGSFLCGLVDFTDVPYPLSCDSRGNVAITGVVVQGATGNCAGTLRGKIDNAAGVISFFGATLPCTTNCPGNCQITGNIRAFAIDPLSCTHP